MADPNQYNVGEKIIWETVFYRYTETTPVTRVEIDLTSCTLAVTDPAGNVSSTSIGTLVHPSTGRYRGETTTTMPGRYTAKWTGSGTYTDELLVLRDYLQIEGDFADVVSP